MLGILCLVPFFFMIAIYFSDFASFFVVALKATVILSAIILVPYGITLITGRDVDNGIDW